MTAINMCSNFGGFKLSPPLCLISFTKVVKRLCKIKFVQAIKIYSKTIYNLKTPNVPVYVDNYSFLKPVK